MKKKIIIRLSRKDEFGWEWAFLIVLVSLLWIFSFMIKSSKQIIPLMFGLVVILISAILYQGFEIIKE
jgi:apolipoprotein N-acyltransferase